MSKITRLGDPGIDRVSALAADDSASAPKRCSAPVTQGVSLDAISAHGMGKDQPVARNDTRAGRQLNRRVEIVVAGASIAQNQ